jgi:hypothetical protein
MRFIDRPLALTVAVFLIGAFIGAILVVLSSNIREFAMMLLQARMLSPVQTVSHLGNIAVFLLIFVNNCVPAVLSFIYPLVLARINWTPPLTERRNFLLLSCYTFVAAFLIGFFSLGAPLATGWVLGGTSMLFSLISTASVHGPLEFAFVLVCVAEPLRIARATKGMSARALLDDWPLLAVSILGLLGSSAIEVFLKI